MVAKKNWILFVKKLFYRKILDYDRKYYYYYDFVHEFEYRRFFFNYILWCNDVDKQLMFSDWLVSYVAVFHLITVITVNSYVNFKRKNSYC